MTIEELKNSFDELEKDITATNRAFIEWDMELALQKALLFLGPEETRKLISKIYDQSSTKS